jgi:hypothetical protein
MDEIFSDSDVQRVFEVVGQRGVAPRFDDLEDHDRELINQFIRADQNPDKLTTPAMLIDACVAGVRTFESLSDPMPRSWAPGWKKFVLYITALNTQTLWDRFQRESGDCRETAIFADWVVSSIGRNGWGPDGNSTPLGKQHSYCMAVAAEAGGGIQINPETGLAEAPDGSAARRYDPAVGQAAGPTQQKATEQNQPRSGVDGPSAEDPASSSGSAWENMKERARQAQQHVNPLALQHGIESAQGALSGAGIAKVDKNTGRIKIRKFGAARAAVQPTRTLTEHLKAYNESHSAIRAQASNDARTRTSVSSAWSKAGALREWAAEVVRASGAEVTSERVEEHANMIAGGIRYLVFMRMCGIDDLGRFYPDGAAPSGTPITTFDDLYGRVVARVGNAQPVDQGIDELLAGSWDEFVRGCRERYC